MNRQRRGLVLGGSPGHSSLKTIGKTSGGRKVQGGGFDNVRGAKKVRGGEVMKKDPLKKEGNIEHPVREEGSSCCYPTPVRTLRADSRRGMESTWGRGRGPKKRKSQRNALRHR